MKIDKETVKSALLIALTALVVVMFMPREGKFRYQFFEGKPWRYGLLTAPFDFPVQTEVDSMVGDYSSEAVIVQSGERIVDRGEVIDRSVYNVLSSLKHVYETNTGGTSRSAIFFLGQLLLVAGVLACFGLYLFAFNHKVFHKRRKLLFLLFCILVPSLISELLVKHTSINLYIIPFAIIPIVIRTFFDEHTALFTHLTAIMICSLSALFPYEFVVLQLLMGIVVIFSLKELSQRSHLVRCGIYVLISYTVFYIALVLFQEGELSKIRWMMFVYFAINVCFTMFSYLFIYMLEKMFGYVSPITLVELSNINNALLKQLSEKAPGTFQHSMQVSILASEAADKIGADTQLIRTGALYHDIGKMSNPDYFTENQQGGYNPHSELTYEESARIVIAHVKDGLQLAEEARLPVKVTRFIETHHGKGIAKYFYNSYCNANPGCEVDIKLFTYPGPNPFTKETAILMMADAVEATSRSLKEYTHDSIKGMIDKIIDGQIHDGLLKNAPLTFKDITTVKEAFLHRLLTIYHTRISYPELKEATGT